MKRDIYQQVIAWKDDPHRKPLVIKGARQVGKTHLMQSFAKTAFRNSFYLNFDEDSELASHFEPNLKPERILRELEIRFDKPLTKNGVLILDEIQACPNALTSLKYFQEQLPQVPIMAAGSLLGVTLANSTSFPVGKVTFLNLYPLTFFEFVQALGHQELYQFITEPKPLEKYTEAIHQKLLGLLKDYFIVGGMPEVVANYAKYKDFKRTRKIQQDIINTYKLDFAKHTVPSEALRINEIWRSLSPQLAKENKKFVFSAIKKSARGREYEKALHWLIHAGLVYQVPLLSTPKLPADFYADNSAFKLYFLDVGLMGACSQLHPKVMLDDNQLFMEYKGALTENFVAQELTANAVEGLYYWRSSGTAEVDFLVPFENQIYPLEVKGGTTTHHKSLKVYQEKFNPPLGSRTNLLNYAHDGKIVNYPLYQISRFPEMTEYLSNLTPE